MKTYGMKFRLLPNHLNDFFQAWEASKNLAKVSDVTRPGERNRLAYERPILDYADLVPYTDLQKEMKGEGGPRLAWRTKHFDTLIEGLILPDM